MEIEKSFTQSSAPQQGDLIARSNFSKRHPFDRFGVVVTADCDMERSRPDHQVTFLRIVAVPDYVQHIWCRKKLHEILRRQRTEVADSFNRLSQRSEPARAAINPERLVEWVKSSSIQEVCDAVGPLDPEELTRFKGRLSRLIEVVNLAEIEPNSSALDALVHVRAFEKGLSPDTMRSAIMQQAKGELARESDEVFFLTSLVSGEQSEGYYVLLDNVGTLRRDQLLDYKSSADELTDGAHRFGRLEKTFKYAIVQRFAFLFQRIGLPDERIDLHKGALEKIA